MFLHSMEEREDIEETYPSRLPTLLAGFEIMWCNHPTGNISWWMVDTMMSVMWLNESRVCINDIAFIYNTGGGVTIHVAKIVFLHKMHTSMIPWLVALTVTVIGYHYVIVNNTMESVLYTWKIMRNYDLECFTSFKICYCLFNSHIKEVIWIIIVFGHSWHYLSSEFSFQIDGCTDWMCVCGIYNC